MPGIPAENYWFRRHEVAYEYAREHVVATGRVLEVGCGEGYGTALLSSVASVVIGVDYDALTVAHAAARYPSARFVRANLAALPVRDGAMDMVATLQVIEHVWNHPEFLRECSRALQPQGRLLITTPNRITFSPGLDEPLDPFHTWEFTAPELTDLLRACGFAITFLGGLHAGPRLAELDSAHGGSLVDAQLATPSEDWSARLRADVASIGTRDFILASDDERDIDESLDLVILATRPGVAADSQAGSST